MTLLAGSKLAADEFFVAGAVPRNRGSSVDLTIGAIYDKNGTEVTDLFALKPGRMVQVVSAEVFNLPHDVTGHVTYKTNLTKRGIWALTVGIVDPGWTGPVSTTLLNFSDIEYVIGPGEPFLRVSFFSHDPIDISLLPSRVDRLAYGNDVRRSAMSVFPQSFLKYDDIVHEAGKEILNKIQTRGLAWVGAIAFIFTIASLTMQVSQAYIPDLAGYVRPSRVGELEAKIEQFERRVRDLEAAAEHGAGTVERDSR